MYRFREKGPHPNTIPSFRGRFDELANERLLLPRTSAHGVGVER